MAPSPAYDALRPQVPMQSAKHPAPPATVDMDERSKKRMKRAHEEEGELQQQASEGGDALRPTLGGVVEQQGSNGGGLDLPGAVGNASRQNHQQPPVIGGGHRASLPQLALPGGQSPRPMGPPSSSVSSGNPNMNNNAFRPSPGATAGPSMRPSNPATPQGQLPVQGSTPTSFSRQSMSGPATPAGSSGFRTPVTGPQTPVGPGQPLPPPSSVREGKAKDPFGGGSSGGGGGGGGAGVDSLQDLMGMTGVDLRAEEEAIQKRGALAQSSVATAAVAHGHGQAMTQRANVPRSLPFYLEIFPLSHHIHKIAARYGLGVEPEVLTYISIATRVRFRNLLESMVTASRHRNWSSHLRPPPMYEGEEAGSDSSRPMYDEEIHDDPSKLLAALAKVEKAEEARARLARQEREERKAARMEGAEGDGPGAGEEGARDGAAEGSAGGGGEGGEEGGKKKGGKKPGVAATARNMTEDKRLKLANKTAAAALGFGNTGKAWMFGGASASSSPSPAASSGKLNGSAGGKALPKPRFAPAPDQQASSSSSWSSSKLAPGSTSSGSSFANPGGWGDLAARQRAQEERERQARVRVTLDDALYALEMERAGGAGRGSGESVLYKTRALGSRAFPPPKNPPPS